MNESAHDKYGVSMVYFDAPLLPDIQSRINDNDVVFRELESHITLLYGLHLECVDEDVMERSLPNNISDITLNNVSYFSAIKYDVLKFEASADWLYQSNKKLTELPHTSNFPEYKPHCTICYLKPGTAQKYCDMFKNKSMIVSPKEVIYRKINGRKIRSYV